MEDNYNRIEVSGVDIIKFGSKAIQSYQKRIFRNDIRTFNNEIVTNEQIKKRFWKLWRIYAFECVWDSLFRKSFLDQHHIEFICFLRQGVRTMTFFGIV